MYLVFILLIIHFNCVNLILNLSVLFKFSIYHNKSVCFSKKKKKKVSTTISKMKIDNVAKGQNKILLYCHININ